MKPKSPKASRWYFVEQLLESTLKRSVEINQASTVSGGCINQCWKLTDASGNHWFVKQNDASRYDMFVAEAAGLEEIRKSNSIRAPRVICHATDNEHAFLVLEFITLIGSINPTLTGEFLARMHRCSRDQYGWHLDNTIGATPQPNTQHTDWISFWRKERLQFQLNLARRNGYPLRDFEEGIRLIEKLPVFFSDYTPIASLLHGDLWGGNCASDENGQPVIFDPATYYGDRECDIAMTELFGGFGPGFYNAYHSAYPLDPGYKTRKTLYNLYHILNHFNLFGGGYGSQAASMTRHLLAEAS